MRTHLARVATIAFAVSALSSCGGDGGGSTPNAPSSPNAVTITILRQNGQQSFSPNPASVGGQTVVFRNSDSLVHRVRLNDGSIDTGDIAPGATSAAVRMPGSGTHYHCSLHTDMIGAVNASGGTPPPECEGPYCGGIY